MLYKCTQFWEIGEIVIRFWTCTFIVVRMKPCTKSWVVLETTQASSWFLFHQFWSTNGYMDFCPQNLKLQQCSELFELGEFVVQWYLVLPCWNYSIRSFCTCICACNFMFSFFFLPFFWQYQQLYDFQSYILIWICCLAFRGL